MKIIAILLILFISCSKKDEDESSKLLIKKLKLQNQFLVQENKSLKSEIRYLTKSDSVSSAKLGRMIYLRDSIKYNFKLSKIRNTTLSKWLKSYKIKSNNFVFNFFKNIIPHNGSINATYDANFDKVYLPYLIYSPNKKMYIDFDSYSWMIGKSGEKVYGHGQSVNIVNLINKTVKEISHSGSSQWVEDAFWLDNQTVILLYNNPERKPSIASVSLKNKSMTYFTYSGIINSNLRYKGL